MSSKNDKERAKKVRILDKIDNMRVIQNNHLIVGELEQAIKVAEQIIDLANEADLLSIVEEQNEFINQVRDKIKERGKIALVKDAFNVLKNDFEKLIHDKQIYEAHDRVVQFKKNYSKTIDFSLIPEIREFFLRDEELWGKFEEEQEELKNNLIKLEKQFKKVLNNDDIIGMVKVLEEAKRTIPKIIDTKIKEQWESNEKIFLNTKHKNELIEKITKLVDQSTKLKDKFLFKEATNKIDEAIALIKNEDIKLHQQKLSNLKQEIIAAETKYNKLYLVLAEYKNKLRENQEKSFLIAAIKNCERIIHISQLIGMTEVEKEYKELNDNLGKEIEKKKSSLLKEKEELMKKAKEIEQVISIENDVMPIVQNFPVKDILGDLSVDIIEKLEQIGSLLNEYRVEVKKNLINKSILTTSSGEVIEEEIPRELFKSGGDTEDIYYHVRSGLTNRLEDTIEDAIITDLIPYNFEIIEVQFNGESIKELDNKTLNIDGVEIKWDIHNLLPQKRVDIRYNLRKRISRTIIFILNNQLWIIKNHSNLIPFTEGIFEAKTPFTNSFGKTLDGLIIEDIIPSHYLHFISEPSNLLPEKTTGMEMGVLFRWNIGILAPGTIKYHYKFLEGYKFEKVKTSINKLNKEGLATLNNGNILGAIEKYKEIKNLLINSLN